MSDLLRLSRAVAIAAAVWAALVAGASLATTITVTSTSDALNGADGVCTLREALLAASTNTASGGAAGECAAGQAAPTVDVIAFAIPGSGVHTIAPTAAFAAITEPVTIDGYTQAGASVNTLAAGSNAILQVEIDAANAGATAPLFRFVAGSAGSQVRGLVVNHLSASAFDIRFAADVRIAGNFLGTNAAGTALAGDGPAFVVQTQSANGTTIGGTALADRNVIAGGSAAQVYVNGSANVVVQGNLIGTNALGTAALQPASAGVGVWLDFTQFTQVGGAQPNAGNVISGNAKGVVFQRGESGTVQGNRIGTDATGLKPVPNDFYGIEIAAPGPGLIGGTAPGEGNVIAFNGGPGVYVNATAGGWRIVGNATFDNGDKGIALAPGPLPLANDALDADTGANARQNFPLIDTVTLSADLGAGAGPHRERPVAHVGARHLRQPPAGADYQPPAGRGLPRRGAGHDHHRRPGQGQLRRHPAGDHHPQPVGDGHPDRRHRLRRGGVRRHLRVRAAQRVRGRSPLGQRDRPGPGERQSASASSRGRALPSGPRTRTAWPSSTRRR